MSRDGRMHQVTQGDQISVEGMISRRRGVYQRQTGCRAKLELNESME